MKYYALRHKPTGALMPATASSTGWNPLLRSSKGPRLFHREIDAKNSLSWWEIGEFTRDAEEGMPSLWRSQPTRRGTLEVIPVELVVQ